MKRRKSAAGSGTQLGRKRRSGQILKKTGDATSQSTQKLVVSRIKDAIRDGRLVPGQRLPEADLIEELKVGRGSIREALRVLAAEGLLELEHHRGARIRTFTRDEVWCLHQIREVLEGLAASLAAGRSGQTHFQAELLEINNACKVAVADGSADQWLLLNARFHELIMQMSGNPCISQNVERSLVAHFRILGFRLLTKDFMERSFNEHLQITDAILRGDSARAEKAMREHILTTRSLIMSVPEHFFSPGNNGGSERLSGSGGTILERI